MVLWLFGLSGSGKTALSNLLLQDFPDFFLIDNDKFRKNVCSSFDRKSRLYTVETLRNYIKYNIESQSKILVNKITPYEEMRLKNKQEIPNFYDVYCKCPIEICKKRDVKGLYKKAEEGLVQHMIGVSTDKDDVFEEPKNSSLVIDTSHSIEVCYNQLKKFVESII